MVSLATGNTQYSEINRVYSCLPKAHQQDIRLLPHYRHTFNNEGLSITSRVFKTFLLCVVEIVPTSVSSQLESTSVSGEPLPTSVLGNSDLLCSEEHCKSAVVAVSAVSILTQHFTYQDNQPKERGHVCAGERTCN